MSETITPLIQKYTVDLASNNNFLFIKGVQYDGHSTRYADITLLNNGQSYELVENEVTVTIRGTKPDNKIIFNECEILNPNVIRVEITQQMSAAAGKSDYEISIISNTENRALTSFPFYIVISKSSFPADEVISSNEFGILVDKIHQVDKLEKDVSAIKEEMREVTDECISSTQDCNEATDRANALISDMEELHQTVSDAEAIRVQNENKRQEDTAIAIENAEKATNDAINATDSLRELEDAVREAENNRVNAENKRQEDTSTAITNAENATQNANEATNNAIQATTNADHATSEAQKRIDNFDELGFPEIADKTIQATSDANQATENANNAIKNAEDATAAAWEAIEAIQDTIGIDDSKESLATSWSSSHTREEIDKAKRISLSNIIITPSDWIDKKVYIRNNKITLSSVIDIYYSHDCFEVIDEMDIHYEQGDGYICFKFTYESKNNIVIDNIMIENYYLPEKFTMSGTERNEVILDGN